MTTKAATKTPLLESDDDVVTTALAIQPDVVSMFERLAKDPSVDPDKLERLIAMQERIMRHNAKAEFDSAFSEMQGEMPIIDERGQIIVNGQVRSKFAKHEDIQAAVKPVLARHGFAINHRNKRLENGTLVIIGILRHRGGHSEEDEFECPADTSGSKNDLQALGSSREYGRRYTTISLLNIVTKNVDDDAQKAGRPAPPEGYDAWFATLEGVADDGQSAFDQAWQRSRPEFKTFIANHDKQAHGQLKAKAAKRR